MKRPIHLWFLAILSFMACAAMMAFAAEIKEKGKMIATQTKARGFVPPLDKAAPGVTQTATFALG